MLPGWERGHCAILALGLAKSLVPIRTITSNITDKWGVAWTAEFIARDLLQNFFDANRARPSSIDVVADGSTVTVRAPATFPQELLVWFGSLKGEEALGKYGEGFKAALVSLLRDHRIEPVSQSGKTVVYMRLAPEAVADSTMRPVLYDFFESPDPLEGTRLVLRGCGADLIRELRGGSTHFYFPENPLLGEKLWSDIDGTAIIYRSTESTGHVFYRNLRRGRIEQIPLVLVLNRRFNRLEEKIGKDRDRNAFGDAVLVTFYKRFAAIAKAQTPSSIIVGSARACWHRGHPLLHQLAKKQYAHWSADVVQKVFGDGYYAESVAHDKAEQIEFDRIADAWRAEGREVLPGYFCDFGVPNPRTHLDDLKRRTLSEQKRTQLRRPSVVESKEIALLVELMSALAPSLAGIFNGAATSYGVAETEVLLGALRMERRYRSHEVFLGAGVFSGTFSRALAVFLHEHAHIFGVDGSRGFTDALTELLEAVVELRGNLGAYEDRWNNLTRELAAERGKVCEGDAVTDRVAWLNADELRSAILRLPRDLVEQALLGAQDSQ
jgi:hypothetical protein